MKTVLSTLISFQNTQNNLSLAWSTLSPMQSSHSYQGFQGALPKFWVSTHSTEVRFASFLSCGFITAIVVNQPESKLVKRTSVHSYKKQQVKKFVVEIRPCLDQINRGGPALYHHFFDKSPLKHDDVIYGRPLS